MSVSEDVRNMKSVSPLVASADSTVRNEALRLAALALKEHQDEIFEANREDLQRAEKAGIAPAVMKRLKFDAHKLSDCLAGIDSLMELENPTGRITLHRQLDEGLILKRVTVPIGVIGIIFEARPDALIQISCLCIKSGNCAVLKGGKETASTNKVLFTLIEQAAIQAGLPHEDPGHGTLRRCLPYLRGQGCRYGSRDSDPDRREDTVYRRLQCNGNTPCAPRHRRRISAEGSKSAGAGRRTAAWDAGGI